MIFKRLRDITKAGIHDGIDKLENPVSLLNQYIRDLEEEIAKAQESVSKHMAIEDRFKQQLNNTKTLIEKRTQQAQAAMEAGEEELARKALTERYHHEQKIASYEDYYTQAKEQVNELQAQLRELNNQYQELKERKHALIARANAAKTQEQMLTAMESFDKESAVKGFARMEERINEKESRVRVMRQQQQFSSTSQQVENLEMKKTIDDQLAQLKTPTTAQEATSSENASSSS
ncbi:PspA/IM30 family protein [Bacillaceae bacterium SIJ1]|uniref:PspA/IM30 family protein n=1 Tax=Litoribacterium kuwaitense TaxID=1398745 RepID=UPI0013EA0233|nr:PspA/IM30 family protein [Litoribacterium kuwaitense]NGP46352.1 PspA/IM30 family protein [Litoribacterium kuwaitense]